MTSPRVGNSGDPLSTPAASSPSSPSTAPSSTDSFQVSAPSLSLPKGGGALRGIDEKFAANPVTGAGALTISIPAKPP